MCNLLINVVMCVTHQQASNLDSLKNVKVHQQRKKAKNPSVLVLSGTVVKLNIQCRRQKSLLLKNVI